MICQKCGSENTTGSKFCHRCGSKLEAPVPTVAPVADKPKTETVICPKCGVPAKSGEKFCRSCGSPLGIAPTEQQAVPNARNTVQHKTVQPVFQQTSVCSKCGTPAMPGEKFCKRCGTPIGGSTPEKSYNTPQQPTNVCAKCGAPFAPGEKFCRICGANLNSSAAGAPPQSPPRPAVCPRCGTTLSPGAIFCRKCGTSITGEISPYAAQTPLKKRRKGRPGYVVLNVLLAAGCITLLVFGIMTIPDSLSAYMEGPNPFVIQEPTGENAIDSVSYDPEDLLEPTSPGYLDDDELAELEGLPEPIDFDLLFGNVTEEGGNTQ